MHPIDSTVDSAPPPRRLPWLAGLAALGLGYWVAAQAGLALVVLGRHASPIWPASGVAFAGLLLLGWRAWPAVFAGSMVVNIGAGASFWAALGPALGNSLEAGLTVWLLHRLAGPATSLARARPILVLIGLALVTPLVSATLGVASLAATGVIGPGERSLAWVVWWAGNAIGLLLVGPGLVAWLRPGPVASPGSRPEAVAVAVAVGASVLLPFGLGWAQAYVVFPALLWAALRFGTRGAGSAVIVVALAATWSTAQGQGPLWVGDVSSSLWLLYPFLGVVTLTGLIVAALSGERQEARQAADRAAAWQEMLYRSTPLPIVTLDLAGLVVGWNPAAERLFGWTAKEVLGRPHPAVPDDHREEFERLLQQVRRGESVRGTHVQRRHRDGRPLHLNVSLARIYAPDGSVRGTMAMLEDVSAAEAARAELRASEERAAVLARATTDAVYDWDITTGKIWWGEGFHILFGYPRSHMPDLDTWTACVHPEDADRVRVSLDQALGTDQRTWTASYRFRRADGAFAEVVDRGFILRDASGRANRMFGAMVDVTELRRIEGALQRAEGRHQRLLKLAADAIFTLSADGTITDLNPAFEEITGYRVDEWVGRPFAPLVHPDDLPVIQHHFSRILSGEAGSAVQVRLRRAGGGEVVFDANATPILQDGAVVGIWGIARDVTERQMAEEAVRKSEEQFRSLIENALDIIAVLDRAGSIRFASPSAGRVLGYRRADLEGQSALTLVHPEDAPGVAAVLAAAHTTPGTVHSASFRVRHAGGRWLHLEAEGKVVSRDGEPQLILNARDATERVRAESRTALFARLAQQLGGATTPRDAGRLIAAAARELCGWDSCTLDLFARDADRFTQVLALDTVDGETKEFGATHDGRAPGSLMRRVLTEGPQLVLRQSAEDITAADRRIIFGRPEPSLSLMLVPILRRSLPIGVLSIQSYQANAYTRDDLILLQALADQCGAALARIQTEHELRAAEEQLRHAQKMDAIGGLAGGVAHDFNNLLTTILATSDLVLHELRDGDVLREDVEEIRRAGLRAAELTRQLLSFSRRQVMAPQVLDLNQLVDSVGLMLRRLIGENIELVVRLEPALERVRADPGQLEQVIVNLAVNARDAMPHGGRLEIETTGVAIDGAEAARRGVPFGRYVRLSFSDTGVGMTDEVRAHIFEPFFTTKAKGKGTGLGLATAYGIVQQSGGQIEVESTLGQGSRFVVVLPATSQAPAEPAPAERRGGDRGNETILLVEDEAPVRGLALRILRDHGYQVLPAASAEEAWQLAQMHSDIDLLFTDVIMTGESGPQLAARLRTIRPNIRVLFMSGYADGAIMDRGALAPGTVFLQKPFSPGDLTTKVRAVLDGPRAKA